MFGCTSVLTSGNLYLVNLLWNTLICPVLKIKFYIPHHHRQHHLLNSISQVSKRFLWWTKVGTKIIVPITLFATLFCNYSHHLIIMIFYAHCVCYKCFILLKTTSKQINNTQTTSTKRQKSIRRDKAPNLANCVPMSLVLWWGHWPQLPFTYSMGLQLLFCHTAQHLSRTGKKTFETGGLRDRKELYWKVLDSIQKWNGLEKFANILLGWRKKNDDVNSSECAENNPTNFSFEFMHLRYF